MSEPRFETSAFKKWPTFLVNLGGSGPAAFKSRTLSENTTFPTVLLSSGRDLGVKQEHR